MTPCYTATYVAPEVLKRQGYDQACDIWSLGVLLYTLLAGYTPYPTRASDSPSEILASIAQHTVDVTSGNWTRVSSTGKSLVEKMLHVDPKMRYRASDVLRHAFITDRHSLPDQVLRHERESSVVKRDVGRIFHALNTQPSLSLNPVVQSNLAKRRANRPASQTMIAV